MFKSSFSFEGRIRRSEFGISFILFAIARVIITITAAGLMSGSNDTNGAVVFSLLLSIPLLWFLWAQGAKRCHDIGNSGWFQLIPFYALWMLFQDGEPGPNQYGENPKDIQNNFYNTNNHNINTNNNNINNYNQNNQTNNSGYPGNYGGGHNSSGLNQPSYRNQNSDNEDGYKNGSLYN
jgi:uncharacterized membrane protein YhaH (DUF805 family)